MSHVRRLAGLVRSLAIYHGIPFRQARLRRFHALFVSRGDLVFDLGAHAGNRTRAFAAMGCRVVAVEPQPHLAGVLKLLYGWRRDVTLVPVAVGASPGRLALHLNLVNPTVATGSSAFIAAAKEADGWREQRWTRQVIVEQTTLDALIAAHGRPAFIKIDVEGFEADVLAGLSQPVAALSFEFTTIQRDVASAALKRCAALGRYRFNAALGESQTLAFADWLDETDIRDWLNGLPAAANSGDIYARLPP